MGLLSVSLALLVFASAASIGLCLPRNEEHGTDVPNNSYWQEIWIGACDFPLSPKSGNCTLRNIDIMYAWTEGHEICWAGISFDEHVDWHVSDGGMQVAQASAAGSGGLSGFCPDQHIWDWAWYGLWFHDGRVRDEWGGYDFEQRDY